MTRGLWVQTERTDQTNQTVPARRRCQRFVVGALNATLSLVLFSVDAAASTSTSTSTSVNANTSVSAAVSSMSTLMATTHQPASAPAAIAADDTPLPYYSDALFVMALAEHHHLPLAKRFHQQAAALQEATRALCPAGQALPVANTPADAASAKPTAHIAKLTANTATPVSETEARPASVDSSEPPAEVMVSDAAGAAFSQAFQASPALTATRAAWLSAANTWAQLDALSVGPVITRRSAKAIDFRPTRPKLILKALAALEKTDAVPDAAAMGKIGSATKGMAAIEWLLWSREAPATEAACRYLRGMVDDVAREAQALAGDYQADAAVDWVAASEDDGQPVAVEGAESAAQRAAMIVNQWLGGLEGLRWRALGKPLAVIETASGEKATDPHRDIWPRPPSASHRQAWQARWASLKQVGIGGSPTDGSGPQPERMPAVVSLEALLRGLGKQAVADDWQAAVTGADKTITALVTPVDDTRLPPVETMKEALAALDRLKWLMQDKVAPALSVTLGFSDADGD